MDTITNTLVQCWGCHMFDRLFQIVSVSAAAVYTQLTTFCLALFCVLFGVTVVYMVWKNLKDGASDAFNQKNLKPLIINSMVAITLLGAGLTVPRLVSRITFEPTAEIALVYTQSLLKTSDEQVNERVTYQPTPMSDNGFFRPQLRDTLVMLMKTTITQFQSYIKLGFTIIDASLSLKMLLGVGAFVKHLLLIFLGAFISYAFFKLFVRFCFYYADIIIAMTMFAFLFPIGIILTPFKGKNMPSWISKLGNGIGAAQIRELINAIIGLVAAIITYTVIMLLIARFFSTNETSATELIEKITTGNVFEADIDEHNMEQMTIMGIVVLVFIANQLKDKIPEVQNSILKIFNVKAKTDLSEKLAGTAIKFKDSQVDQAKRIGKNAINANKNKNATTTPAGGKK